jgi:hypothetical protein
VMDGTPKTPQLWPGGKTCQCAACEEFFLSVSGFDMHRVGDPDRRRCLTPDEMRALGMSKNAGGLWITKARVLAVR